jgi:hypothetical protein
MKLSSYPTGGFGTSKNLFFTQIMNVEVCEVLTKPKLHLVQEWPFKNEFIDLCNKKI